MSNVKHPPCAIRALANEAKSRLKCGGYDIAPKTALLRSMTPLERQLYDRLAPLIAKGHGVTNPIAELVDRNYVLSLEQSERTRFVFEVSSAYVSLKRKLGL